MKDGKRVLGNKIGRITPKEKSVGTGRIKSVYYNPKLMPVMEGTSVRTVDSPMVPDKQFKGKPAGISRKKPVKSCDLS